MGRYRVQHRVEGERVEISRLGCVLDQHDLEDVDREHCAVGHASLSMFRSDHDKDEIVMMIMAFDLGGTQIWRDEGYRDGLGMSSG